MALEKHNQDNRNTNDKNQISKLAINSIPADFDV